VSGDDHRRFTLKTAVLVRNERVEKVDTIYRGDCLQLLQTVPSGSVDLVVSSPPYNIGKAYESKRALDIYLDEQRVVLAECARVLSDKGSVFWQVGSFSDKGTLVPLDVKVFPILEGFGLLPRNRMIWVRPHGLHARNKFSARYETILWFTKSDRYPFHLDAIRVPQKYQNKKAWTGENKGSLTCHPDGKNPGDIWLFQNVKHNHEEQTIHPCQFPEDMIARIVLAVTDEGDTVLDPYMGTGTVAVVARDHGRHFVGAEMDPTYHSIAMRRLSGLPDEQSSFPNLKTLRAYVERTGANPAKFRFDVQVGEVASTRGNSKIYSEEYHREAHLARLEHEEECFSADLRDEPHPEPRDPRAKSQKPRNDEAPELLWD
jgi:adenine-specific DNA-methyltransferase